MAETATITPLDPDPWPARLAPRLRLALRSGDSGLGKRVSFTLADELRLAAEVLVNVEPQTATSFEPSDPAQLASTATTLEHFEFEPSIVACRRYHETST